MASGLRLFTIGKVQRWDWAEERGRDLTRAELHSSAHCWVRGYPGPWRGIAWDPTFDSRAGEVRRATLR